MKKVIASVALASALATSAFGFGAANSNVGCGLGSSLLANQKGVVWNLLQITTNGTLGTQTFGITSGTSGCKYEGIVMDDRTQMFVADNMDALSKEIAKGEGEHLDTLVELLGVNDGAAFKIALQDNYNKIYANSSVEMNEVLTSIEAL